MEDTYTVTIDATVTVTVDGDGTSGTVSGTKTSEGISVVEGIFDSGITMDEDGKITDQWDDRPSGPTQYGEGTVSLDDTFGITVPSKEELLTRLREAVATKLRIEAIMAYDPDVGANLASSLAMKETMIADLEAAAAVWLQSFPALSPIHSSTPREAGSGLDSPVVLITTNIEDIRLGQRVVGTNPLREQTHPASDINPETWRAVELVMHEARIP